MGGMTTLFDTPTIDTDADTTPDARLDELRDWVRTQPLGLVHAAMHSPAATFTGEDLDLVSDAVSLDAAPTVAVWSAEAAALHDFYRRHHEDVTALRDIIGEGMNPHTELARKWAARTGVSDLQVRSLLSLTQAAVIGEWWASLAQGSIAARDRGSALMEINSAAEAIMDIAGQLEDAPHLSIARVAACLEEIGEDEWAKLRRILPDMVEALRDARHQLEREAIFATSRHRSFAQAAA